MGKRSILISLSLFSLPLGWLAYGLVLEWQIPAWTVQEVSPLSDSQQKHLPFFEVMSPLPNPDLLQVVPRLDYAKGPPARFLDHLQLVLQEKENSSKERITFYGRRSQVFPTWLGHEPEQTGWILLHLLRKEKTEISWLSKPFWLKEVASFFQGAEKIYFMNQSESPAFFVEYAGNRPRAQAFFFRRNSFYRVEYLAEQRFSQLDPLDHFRKSFVVDKRATAMQFLGDQLSQVQLQGASGESLAWPILLIAANLSLDPSSLDSFFHFAGLSSMLYKKSIAGRDLESQDLLRNNVLASELYAKDISADSSKTAEISRLGRLLTRQIEP